MDGIIDWREEKDGGIVLLDVVKVCMGVGKMLFKIDDKKFERENLKFRLIF